MSLDYDKYGHCVNCGKNLLIDRIINYKRSQTLSPEYDTEDFLMSDNTIMKVSICKKCKKDIDDKDYKKIMGRVVKGWYKEMDLLTNWPKEKKEKYMEKYSKLEIKKKKKYNIRQTQNLESGNGNSSET